MVFYVMGVYYPIRSIQFVSIDLIHITVVDSPSDKSFTVCQKEFNRCVLPCDDNGDGYHHEYSIKNLRDAI